MPLSLSHSFLAPADNDVEVIERKGLGHPDTLADGIAEATAIAYENYCRDKFGYIPHHNLDKLSIMGGMCKQKFGGTNFIHPIKLQFMGRASRSFGDTEIPLGDIQLQAAKEYLKRVLPHLRTDDKEVLVTQTLTSSYSTRDKWYSPDGEQDLPEYSGDHPTANDTATMISYWPLTKAEKLTLDLEGYFYRAGEYNLPVPRFDYIGQDIKVMTVRRGNSLKATLCVPQITTHTPDLKTYKAREKQIEQDLHEYAAAMYNECPVDIIVNTQMKTSNPRPYLTTGGSCLDFGEEGAVGRGNKTHGIISSFRPNTMEAPHGKNPTYFVGKILGYLADKIAQSIHEETGVTCQVVLQANIGDSVFAPSTVLISTSEHVDKSRIDNIVDRWFSLGRTTTNLIIDELHFIPRTNVFEGA